MVDVSTLLDICAEAIGAPLLAYVLNVSESNLPKIRQGQSSEAQNGVLTVLQQIVDLRLPLETDATNRRQVLRAIITQADDAGISIARHLYRHAGEVDPSSSRSNALQGAIADLAIDEYPAFLLPQDPDYPFPMGTNIHVTSSIFRHSRRDEFVE